MAIMPIYRKNKTIAFLYLKINYVLTDFYNKLHYSAKPYRQKQLKKIYWN